MRNILCALLFLCVITLSAQEQQAILDTISQPQKVEVKKERTMGGKFLYDMGNIAGGMGYAFTRPLHWEGKQWAQTAGALAGTALLMLTADKPARDFMSRMGKDVPNLVMDYGWYYGSPQNNYMLTGAVYLTGLFTDNEKLRRTGVLLVTSASVAGLLQQTAKFTMGRARPMSGEDPTSFKFFEKEPKYHSFPSGHMVLAMTNAYAISKQFSNPWVKGGILFLGTVPGLTRMWDNAHWLSDIALSTVISIATVEGVDRYLDSKYAEKYNDGTKKVSWNLAVSHNQLGVIITF